MGYRQMPFRERRKPLVEEVWRNYDIPFLFEEPFELRVLLDCLDHDQMEALQRKFLAREPPWDIDHQDVGQARNRTRIINPSAGNRAGQSSH